MSTQWLRLWIRRVVIDGVCAAALERIKEMHEKAAAGEREGMSDAGSLRSQADAMHADYKEVKEEIRRAVSRGGDSLGRADTSVHTQAHGASVVQIEQARLLPWLMLCCLLSTFALATAIGAILQLARTEREFRLLQIQQQMTNAWLARAGLLKPEDVFQGPEGNVFYKPKEK